MTPRRTEPAIGVLTAPSASLATSRTLDAITVAAAAEGYAVTVLHVDAPGTPAAARAARVLGSRAVDGVVVLDVHRDLGPAGISVPPGLPAVVVGANPQDTASTVDTDHVQGAAAATEYLLGLGHESVWHVAGPTDSFAALGRERGWRRTLAHFDRKIPPAVTGDWTAESGYRLGHILCREPTVTAVFAANDQMALGVLRALHESGRSVPGDVSVAGFDDIPEAASFWPPLTTVRQSFPELGRQVVRTLLAELCFGTREETSLFVPATLAVRSSTGPAPW
ncbi:substrate-binding domain-containing protein [Amycolatopsis sp. NEAU-NG30]|uniref:Substrate-binding domain-containing protein n=1 Tax=Amycolatopsis melonis TaxID=3156488 RepID=A0ABV0LAU1_9PSEU